MSSRKLEVVFVGDTSSLDKSVNRLGGTAGKTESKLSKLGKAMAGAFVVDKLASGAKFAINSATDLGEQVNKASVVFRGSEKDILAWSKTTASSLGISRREALESAGVFGNMLVPMGFARGKAADMSKGLVKLSADMASFNNANPADVLEALRSGLSGETEPLRKFGVFLNDARLKQEALSMGLYKGKGPLDAQAKAQATYALILKDTKDAQGDFTKTSGSLANQQRILKANVENLAAGLGQSLLPAAQKVTAVAVKMLTGFQKLPGPIQTGIGILGGLAVAATALGLVLGPLATTFGVVGSAATAMQARVAAAAVAAKISTTAAFGIIGIAILAAIAVGVLVIKHWDAIKGAAVATFGAIKSVVVGAWDAISGATRAVWSGIRAVVTTYLSAVRAVVTTYFNAYRSIITGAWHAVEAVSSAVWSTIRSALSGAWSGIRSAASSAWGGIRDSILGAIRGARDAIGGVVGGIRDRLVGGFHSALSAVKSFGNDFAAVGTSIPGKIAAGIKGAAGVLADAANWIKDKIVGFVKGALGIHSPSRVFADIGGNIVEGLIKGMDSGDIGRFMKSFIGSVPRVAAGLIKTGVLKASQVPKAALKRIAGVAGAVGGGVSGLINKALGHGKKKKGHAMGGVASGGWVRVGEQGPEWAQLPAGTRVHAAGESARMGGGGPLIGQVIVHGSVDARVLARDLAWQLETR